MYIEMMYLFILVAIGLSIWAQSHVKRSFAQGAGISSRSGLTGYEAARRMLDSNGLHEIQIERIAGALTDHYDPLKKTVRLSEAVFNQSSIAAISVACHEVGHAIQHNVQYPMLVLRHRMFPFVNFTAGIAPFLLIIGLILSISELLEIGILFFSGAVAFQLVTLPVEFDASSRARHQMITEGFIYDDEQKRVSKILNAAALTYVAAALVYSLQLIKFILIFLQRR